MPKVIEITRPINNALIPVFVCCENVTLNLLNSRRSFILRDPLLR